MSHKLFGKVEAGQVLDETRRAKVVTWKEPAEAIDKLLGWTVAACSLRRPAARGSSRRNVRSRYLRSA
jgi:hypothetical protein